MQLQQIYSEAGLSPEEVGTIPLYISGELDEFWESTAHDKLFEYFAFEAAEMPYGVAKARTGCPDEWILDRLETIIKGETNAKS